MKVIIAIALIFAIASVHAVNYCVDLTKDDTTCEGHQSKFPSKICWPFNSTVASSSICDLSAIYTAWTNACPLKNSGNASFCEGTGYSLPYVTNPHPCSAFVSCSSDSDCNAVAEPAAPVAFVPYCYDCCLYCFDDATCAEKTMAATPLYTNSTTCTACKPAEPVATTTPSASNTPGSTNTPSKKSSTGAVVVVSGIVLAFSALLF